MSEIFANYSYFLFTLINVDIHYTLLVSIEQKYLCYIFKNHTLLLKEKITNNRSINSIRSYRFLTAYIDNGPNV